MSSIVLTANFSVATGDTPSGLALPARGQFFLEKWKMLRTPSGRGCHWQRSGKNKKKHACRLVCPCLPMGQNFKERNCQARHMVLPWPSLAKNRKNKKSHARRLVCPYLPKGQNFKENDKCHARHMVWPQPSLAKKGKTKHVMHTAWSGRDWHPAKKNKKCHARNTVWPWLSAVIAMGQKKTKNEKCHACHLVWPCQPEGIFLGKNGKCHAHRLAVAVIGK